MNRYKLVTMLGAVSIHDQTTGIWIPEDPQNIDYQAFLEWVAAGNTPDEWSGP